MAGESPAARYPHPTPSRTPSSGRRRHARPSSGRPPGPACPGSWHAELPARLSPSELTKASLGEVLGSAILPDSMSSCHSASGDRRMRAGCALWLHPCPVRKAWGPPCPALPAASSGLRGLGGCGCIFLADPEATPWKNRERFLFPELFSAKAHQKGHPCLFWGLPHPSAAATLAPSVSLESLQRGASRPPVAVVGLPGAEQNTS